MWGTIKHMCVLEGGLQRMDEEPSVEVENNYKDLPTI